MTCQPTQDLFFPLLIGSESGMPSESWWLPRRLDVNPAYTPVNTQSAGKDRMERPLQVSQHRQGPTVKVVLMPRPFVQKC